MLTLATSTAEAAGSGATAEQVLFWIFAGIALGSGLAVVTLRNIVHAALMLVVNLLSVAGLYLGLQSGFLSIAQVIVYAGAIVVLFLFVIMLLGVDRDDLLTDTNRVRVAGAAILGVVLAGGLVFAVGANSLTTASACGDQAVPGAADALTCVGLDEALAEQGQGSVSFLAETLFTRYTFAFEISALLLVVATLGALVLGRRSDPSIEDEAGTPSAPTPSDEDLEDLIASQAALAEASGLRPEGSVLAAGLEDGPAPSADDVTPAPDVADAGDVEADPTRDDEDA